MSIAHLKTLLVIRGCGSFLAASERLNLSHSAISVQMKQLEKRLGRNLFHKGKRPAKLTSFGSKYSALAAIDAIEALVTKGVGVSVVPQRLFAANLGDKMQCLDFPVRNNQRVLSLIFHRENERETILCKLVEVSGQKYRRAGMA